MDTQRQSDARLTRQVASRLALPGVALLAVPAFVIFRLASSTPVFPPGDPSLPGANAVRAADGPAAAAHVEPPKFVKGIYVTSSTVSSKRRFAELVALVDRTELNAMVIDIKNGKGEIAFAPRSSVLKPFAEAKPALGDLLEFIKPLHEKGIYLIARQFVFQDPALVAKKPEIAVQRAGGGVWRDRKGVPWIDAAATEAWKYNVLVAKEAFAGGFDEVQFDYVRFPSDGNISALRYPSYDGSHPKAEVLRDFFSYLDSELRVKAGMRISVDLFGLTMWNHASDLGIGQRLENAVTHFDFVSPMVYPSHYPTGFEGFANPAEYPYRIVYDNMVKGQPVFEAARQENARKTLSAPAAAIEPVATVRPWLQDFDLGANYDAAMVREQMKAAVDGGASGWLLWNARNVYTEEALKQE